MSVEELLPRIPAIAKSPRSHQQEAIDNIIKGFQTSSFGQLHMACGTGKTLVGLWVHESLQSFSTLVLVPSISLVSQLYREWSANAREQFDPIFVCSDPTVKQKEDEVERIIESSAELGFQVTTDPADIVKHFTSGSEHRPKIIFSTYHSSPVLEQACKMNELVAFDLVIADEAHRCAGKASSDFACVVDPDAFRAKKKLFMTATPKIFSDNVKAVTKENDCEIVSMDDPKKFGPVFHAFSFSQAIEQDLLSDYQVLISVMDNKTYREYAERGRFVTFNGHETDARTLASQIMVAKAIKEFGLKKIITFHGRQKTGREFAGTLVQAIQLLPEQDRVTFGFNDVIFGDMQQRERLQKIKKFDAVLQPMSALLANVRCLSEGVDVPALDGVVFVDPKGSEIDIVQAVGRAIRKSPNKQLGKIIIPVFVEHEELSVVNLENSAFKKVWQVLKALRAHDDVLAEELDTIRLELGKQSYRAPAKLKKILIDVPVGVDVNFSKSLQLKIVERCTESWNYFFGLLQQFRQLYPDRWPSDKEHFPEYNTQNLGSWCGMQRLRKKKSRATDEQIKKLDEIGFSWDLLNDRWEEQFSYLLKFRELYPARWPKDKECFPEHNSLNLGSWCGTQRQRYKKKKLAIDRIKKLDAICFQWDPLNDIWEEAFNYLKEFRERHPNRWPRNKDNFIIDKVNLCNWSVMQRQEYEKGKLTDVQIEKLNSIGFRWDPINDTWEEQFSFLRQFRSFYPDRWPKDKEWFPENNNQNLGSWCGAQRRLFNKDKLSISRIERLNGLGFPWITLQDNWDEQFEHLLQFRFLYPDRWPKNKEYFPETNNLNLGMWCSNQRQAYKKGKLSVEQLEKLNGINFQWDSLDYEWDQQFSNLILFRNEHPNRWPKQLEEYPAKNRIGAWCSRQRQRYKSGSLSKNREKKLQDIGFIF